MRTAIVAILVIMAPAARAVDSVQVTGSVFDQSTSDRIVEIFWEACPMLKAAKADIISIILNTGEEYAPHRLKLGWKKEAHFSVRLSESPTTLPAFDEKVGTVAGHTLHYNVGGGKKPGILGSKRVSQMLCGMSLSEVGADTFKFDQSFAFIKY